MKIAHFLLGRCNPDTANGVEKTVYHLAVIHASLGDEVAIFSINEKPPIEFEGVVVRTYLPPRFKFSLPPEMLDDMSRMMPDVIHIHSGYVPYNIAMGWQARKWGIPYVVTPNGNCARQVLRRRPWVKIPYKFAFEKGHLNKAAFVHAVGDGDDVRDYGVKVPIVDAPNGIDLAAIPANLDGNIVEKRYPATRGKKVFMYLGRLDPIQKGLDLLLDGFAGAVRNGHDIVLVLVGPDWNGGKKRLEKQVAKLNITENVIFWGAAYGKEKYDLIASGDFFVHTSRWEGLAFAVIEALACGKPCLLSNRADPCGHLVKTYKAGIIVDAQADEIRDGIQFLRSCKKDEIDQMSANAKRLVADELNWKTIALAVRNGYSRYAFNKNDHPAA